MADRQDNESYQWNCNGCGYPQRGEPIQTVNVYDDEEWYCVACAEVPDVG